MSGDGPAGRGFGPVAWLTDRATGAAETGRAGLESWVRLDWVRRDGLEVGWVLTQGKLVA